MTKSLIAEQERRDEIADNLKDDRDTFDDIKQSDSMMELILQDPETSSTVSQMILSAKHTLMSNWHHKTIYKRLETMIKKDGYFDAVVGNRFSNGIMHLPIEDYVTCSAMEINKEGTIVYFDRMADIWIKEIFKFISLKIMIGHEDKARVETDERDDEFNEDPDTTIATKDCRNIHKRLSPSKPVYDGWQVLISHPSLYSEICKAMGSDNVVDLTVENNKHENGEKYGMGNLDRKMWDFECYNWTLHCYEILYDDEPSEIFWPRMKLNDDSMSKNVGLRFAEFVEHSFDQFSTKLIDVMTPCQGINQGLLKNK